MGYGAQSNSFEALILTDRGLALSFDYLQVLIAHYIGDGFVDPAGPLNRYCVNMRAASNTEEQARLILAKVSISRLYDLGELSCGALNSHTSTDCVAFAFGPNQFKLQEIARLLRSVLQQYKVGGQICDR